MLLFVILLHISFFSKCTFVFQTLAEFRREMKYKNEFFILFCFSFFFLGKYKNRNSDLLFDINMSVFLLQLLILLVWENFKVYTRLSECFHMVQKRKCVTYTPVIYFTRGGICRFCKSTFYGCSWINELPSPEGS